MAGMGFYQQQLYKEFAQGLNNSIDRRANLLIISVPGMSVTYFIKRFLDRPETSKIIYITGVGEKLGDYNILDLNFDKDSQALKIADTYFRQANLNQKFALVINTPQILDTDDFKQTYLSSHISASYYFQPLDLEMIKIFAGELNTRLSDSDARKISGLSGGIGRIIKFLIVNKNLLGSPVKDLLINDNFKLALMPTVNVVSGCDDKVLQKLDIKNDSGFNSQILAKYFEANPVAVKFDVQIQPDLIFTENGIVSPVKLTKTESLVLKFLVESGGFITKEKISEIKWGGSSYDQFSDQAIGKSMQRLGKKLKHHRFEVIPLVGYKLHPAA